MRTRGCKEPVVFCVSPWLGMVRILSFVSWILLTWFEWVQLPFIYCLAHRRGLLPLGHMSSQGSTHGQSGVALNSSVLRTDWFQIEVHCQCPTFALASRNSSSNEHGHIYPTVSLTFFVAAAAFSHTAVLISIGDCEVWARCWEDPCSIWLRGEGITIWFFILVSTCWMLSVSCGS